MAGDTSAEDRTEEPTARRLERAREDGEAARSTEMPAAAVVIAAASVMVLWGATLAGDLKSTFAAGFVFDRKTLSSVEMIPAIFAERIAEGFLAIMPVLLVTMVAAILASGVAGG